ncbi:MAG: glycosyl hydrolase family 5, partial [Bacteroidaceae bacterium]|nr:glycosyl hydrolase family 5 [Bacteroidaceae bacterium]
MRKYVKIAALLLCALPSTVFAQFGVVQPLHVQGNQFRDPYGNKVVLHGVMDTPNPYFNSYRWGYSCNDGSVNACLNYFEKLFTAITDTKQGAYCNLFRLHL